MKTSPFFSDLEGIVFDIDGTLIHDGRAIPGAIETLALLRRRCMPLVFCTQEAEKTEAEFAARLVDMGLDVDAQEIVTCGAVAAEQVATRFANARVSALITDKQRALYAQRGIIFLAPSEPADFLVVGIYDGFSARDFETACAAVWSGAGLVAMFLDRSFRHGFGLAPGAGAFVRAIEHATRCRAEVLGKPSRAMGDAALRKLKCSASATLMVGDSLDSDVALAKAAGFRSLLLLNGVTSKAEAARASAGKRPDVVLPSISEFYEALRETA